MDLGTFAVIIIYRLSGHCSSLPIILFSYTGKSELSFLPIAGCSIYSYIPDVPFTLEISGVNRIKYF